MNSTTGPELLAGRPTSEDLASAHWFSSKMSSSSGGCLEVAHFDGWVAVRDTEDPTNPPFVVRAFVWECLLDGAKNGEFDLPTS
jgi:hypothetical protein